MKDTKIAGFHLSLEIIDKIEKYANEKYMMKSGVVMTALEDFFKKHEKETKNE